MAANFMTARYRETTDYDDDDKRKKRTRELDVETSPMETALATVFVVALLSFWVISTGQLPF